MEEQVTISIALFLCEDLFYKSRLVFGIWRIMPDAENASNVQYPANPDDWIKWTQRWWEAMLEIPKGSNPIADPDGTYFKTFKKPADAEDVWFIGGGLNDEDIRKIDVKKGKAIFGPIVNYIACKNPGFGNPNLYGAPQGSSLEQEVQGYRQL